MNPVGNVYCDKCHARIVPLVDLGAREPEPESPTIRGLSLPTIPLEEETGLPTEETEKAEAEEDWLAQLRSSEYEIEEEERDWLTQLRVSAVEEAREPEAEIEPVEPVEVPDWLRDMGPLGVEAEEEPEPEEAAPEMPSPAPAELPDWLRELAPPEEAVAEAPPEEEAAPAMPTPAPAEIPDWLRELAPPEEAVAEAPPEEAVPAMPTPAPAEIPDWLQELAAAPEEAVAEAPPEEAAPAMPTPVPVEIPDWLQELAAPEEAVAEAPPEEPVPAMPTPAPVEIPDWLQEIALPEEAVAEAPPEEAAPAMPTPALAELPDWLREAAPPEEAAPEVALPAAEAAPEEAVPAMPPPAPAELPDWLRGVAPPEAVPSVPPVPAFEEIAPSPPSEPGAGVAEVEGLARAEIPAWLEALRPRPETAEAAAEEEPVETTGLLEGLRGVLAPTSTAELPAVRQAERPIRGTLATEISEVSLARAQLLQSLLVQPAEVPQPEERGRVISMGERIQRLLVALVLIVVVLGILIAPQFDINIPPLTQPASFSRVSGLYNAVQSMSTANTVLVAFEYGPSEADELNVVAEPILRHLLDQGADISVVSTRPEGKAVAAGLLGSIVSSSDQYTVTQYTLSSYLPGNAAGVSQLLADADTHPSLILVLTAQPGPLRWWVEQTRARGASAPPLAARLSAALEPCASPYLDVRAQQLAGTVNGLSEAAAYEAHGGLRGKATQRLNALAAGHIAIVGLMILGAVLYAPSGLLRGKK